MKIVKQFRYFYNDSHNSEILFGLGDDGEVYYSFNEGKIWQESVDSYSLKQMIAIVKEFGHLINLL